MTDFLFGKVNISIFCTVEWSLAFHLEMQYNAGRCWSTMFLGEVKCEV